MNVADAGQTLQALEWLQLLGLGGLAGALGQGGRVMVGLKKANDAASTSAQQISDVIVAHRIFISLAIGFVAGALGAIGMVDSPSSVTTEQVFGLAGIGYVGTDAIEGLISRVRGTTAAAPGEEVVGVGAPARDAVPDDAVG